MNEELRAMTLSMAIEWAKSQDPKDAMDPDAVIAAAKKFEKHIQGTGFETPPPGLIFGGGSH